ncbi:MAG: APC family permease, partial [Actinomycetales bacterium]|nr:APC family permease [Actinomycetales bacterium]
VIALAAVNYRGVTRTAALTRILVVGSGAALLIVLGAGWAGVDLDAVTLTLDGVGGPYGVLQSAGLLFFAFAGYARIATMGEEVRDPERSIPRAIMLALGIVVVLYAVVALTLLTVLGPELLAASAAPLAELAPDLGWVALVARVGASVAALGALLGLVAGVGRTSLAMARERDLPRWLDAVHPVHRVPHHAEVALAVVVAVLVLTVDLREAIGFSSFGVLTYYFIANASAFTQEPSRRRFPRAAQVAGMVGCAVLALTLPVNSVLAGLAVFAVGIAYRALRLRRGVR